MKSIRWFLPILLTLPVLAALAAALLIRGGSLHDALLAAVKVAVVP